MVAELNDISTNIHSAGAKYSAIDDGRASALAGARGSAMGGPNGSNGYAAATAAPAAQVHPQATPAVSNGHHAGVQLAGFGAKQNGGAVPAPGYDDPFIRARLMCRVSLARSRCRRRSPLLPRSKRRHRPRFRHPHLRPAAHLDQT